MAAACAARLVIISSAGAYVTALPNINQLLSTEAVIFKSCELISFELDSFDFIDEVCPEPSTMD